MGKEATCDATLGGRRVRTRAHLDVSGLVLRGAVRLRVAREEARDVRVDGGALVMNTPVGELSLELGAAATRWASEFNKPKRTVEKFGMRPDDRVYIRRVTNLEFLDEVAGVLRAAPRRALQGAFDCIVAQFDSTPALNELETLARHLVPNGAVWLVTPKGRASPVPEAAVRAAISRAGLVDVKIAAFDATHTATKAVIPLARRGLARETRRGV